MREPLVGRATDAFDLFAQAGRRAMSAILDEVCENTIAEMRTLTPAMRSLVMGTIRQDN